MEQTRSDKPRLLLHSCCGPCSTAVIERLIPDYDITIFFYNPNIDEGEEYEKRRDTQVQFLTAYNQKITEGREDGEAAEKAGDAQRPAFSTVKFLEGDYDPQEFYKAAEGLEHIPEGGARCTKCFELRLGVTAQKAKELGFDLFGTTLTVSPHKNYPLISKIGNQIAEEISNGGQPEATESHTPAFLDLDFKKKAGYQRSVALSKEYELYRQHFCGCSFARKIQEEQQR